MRRRYWLSLIIAVIMFAGVALPVLAVPGTVTNLQGVPATTTVVLSWIKATSSSQTRIRVLTTTFPTSATGADGSTSVYLGTSNSVTHSSLSAGVTYYYAAWGYDGVDYSVTATTLAVTTKATATSGQSFPKPSLPTGFLQAISGSSLTKLEPFRTYVAVFASDWGMPVNNMWMFLYSLLLVVLAVFAYIQFKEPLVAWAVVMLGDLAGIYLVIIPGWTFFIFLFIGFGVWAIERGTA